MNTKIILSLVTLGILMVSSLGNVSAGDVGLWISSKNDMGNHEPRNCYSFNEAYTIYFDNNLSYTGRQFEYPKNHFWYGPDEEAHQPSAMGMYYWYPEGCGFGKPIRISFSIAVMRSDTLGLTKYYERTLTPTMSMPVAANGWINGISKTTGGTGMYFTASDVYSGGAYMDWIRCYDADKEVFSLPGGKFHWPQGWEINYPNGQFWK